MANTAVAKSQPAGALVARPDFIKDGDRRGTEKITKDDLQMPRLSLAQALSPQLDPTSPRYIEGLKLGDAFNELTGEIYGRGPIELVIVRVDTPRFIEFDATNRGQIVDFNVPVNDPRTQFTTDENGKTVKPLATKFMEYVALLLPSKEPIAVSFKGSGLKVAKHLNGLIRLANLPAFALRYHFSSSTLKDPKSGGSYAVFNVKYAGGGVAQSYVDAETYALAGQTYDSIKDQTLAIEREPGADDELGGTVSADPKVGF